MEQQVNLWQPILRAEKRLFSAGAIGTGLAVLLVALGVLAAYAAWHTRRAEAAVAAVERQEAARLAQAERAQAGLATTDAGALERAAATLATQIAAREHALAVVGSGASLARGFAARLEALGRPPIDGVWLRRVVFDPTHGGVALQGATRDPKLVPAWLAALQGDPALAGAAFADFDLRAAGPGDGPAAAVFTAAAPGLRAVLQRDPFEQEQGR